MSILRRIFYLIGTISFSGAILGAPSADAQQTEPTSAEQQLADELACERALEANTIEALEDYLRLYPQGSCRALALNSLRDFAPNDRDLGREAAGQSVGVGYGS